MIFLLFLEIFILINNRWTKLEFLKMQIKDAQVCNLKVLEKDNNARDVQTKVSAHQVNCKLTQQLQSFKKSFNQ